MPNGSGAPESRRAPRDPEGRRRRRPARRTVAGLSLLRGASPDVRSARRRLLRVGIAFLLGGAEACASGGGWEGTALDPAATEFAPELGVDLDAMERTANGLYLLELEEGSGSVAQARSRVRVHYALWLADGRLVDTSVGGEPFHFRLGGSEVVRGWNQGIPGMKVGGRRRLVVRPGLGYGSRGSARVPPDATLIFEVELVEVSIF